MPIPQLSKKTRSPQNWRHDQSQKPFSRSKNSSIKKLLKKSRSSRGSGDNFNELKKHILKSRYHRKNPKKLTLANLIYYSLIICLIGAIIGAIYLAWLSRDLPNPDKMIDRTIAESTKIYDRTGETILYEIHGAEKRTIIKLEEIPEYMKWATITAEDRTFYEHSGFNFLALIRSVLINPLKGKRVAGGSTLTQQLVKNAILTSERKISRKVKELVLSYRIEKKFSKDEILQMYFNEIPYGSTAYGVEAASRRFFGVSVKDVNLPQAAILAAIPNAPTHYSPYGNNIDKLIDRQQYILNEMEELGYIDEQDLEVALGYELEFQEPRESIIAPHFVMYVRELLSEKYGDQVIEQEGLKIYTTIDLYKQKIAEEVIEERAEKNETEYNATNASLVSIDPKTGQILAMVGSRDYFNDDIDGQVNVALRLRQPGSSLKPLVYATAFQKGYTPNTILYDVVTNFAADGKPYEPHNYDLKERGPVTMRKALAGSLNIPAVKALYLSDVGKVVEQAQKMGYTSLTDPERYGLSLVLGGGEVKLLEHTSAYGCFAREGECLPSLAILKIEDRHGEVIKEWEEEIEPVQAIPKEIVRLINNILSDNNARSYIFGENNWLTLKDRPVAAKTGTTNDYKDAWTIGYTPSLVTGVWVGNNDNTEMKSGASGGTVAAPIWHNYMQRVLGSTPVESFNAPKIEPTGKAVLDGTDEGKIKVKIDKISGLLANENTPPNMIEEKEFVQAHSLLYYCDKDDPRGEIPGENSTDPQFPIWEQAIQKWAEENELTLETAPTESDNIHRPENIPQATINAPNNNETIREKELKVEISATAPLGIGRAEYYVDDYLIGIAPNYPYNLSRDINFLSNGKHKLTVKVCDIAENCWQGIQQFKFDLDDSRRDTSLNLSLTSPRDNSETSADRFPLELKILTFRPEAIKNISFYYLMGNETTPHLITVNENINDNEAITFWSEAPEPGSYRLYAEAQGFSDNSIRTPEIRIKVVD